MASSKRRRPEVEHVINRAAYRRGDGAFDAGESPRFGGGGLGALPFRREGAGLPAAEEGPRAERHQHAVQRLGPSPGAACRQR